MNEIEALTEFYTAAVDSLKAKLAESQAELERMTEQMRQSLHGCEYVHQAEMAQVKAKLAEVERQNKAMREVLESVAQLAPDFLDNEDGHFSKAVAKALSTPITMQRGAPNVTEELRKMEKELKATKQWHGTPPKGEAKDIRATLESCCTPEIIKYYEDLKEDE